MTQAEAGKGLFKTLAEARAETIAKLEDGVRCPCCDQMAMKHSFRLSPSNCRFLFILYRFDKENPGKFVHIDEVLKRDDGCRKSRDYNRLAHWKLMAPEPSTKERKGRSGLWQITDAGRRFVRRETTIQERVWIYDHRILCFEGPQVYIDAFEGEDFNYDQEMKSGLR